MSQSGSSISLHVIANLSGTISDGYVWSFRSSDIPVGPHDGAMTLNYPAGTEILLTYTLESSSSDNPYLIYANMSMNTSNGVGITSQIVSMEILGHGHERRIQFKIVLVKPRRYGLILMALSDQYPVMPILSPDPQVSNDPIPS